VDRRRLIELELQGKGADSGPPIPNPQPEQHARRTGFQTQAAAPKNAAVWSRCRQNFGIRQSQPIGIRL